MYRLPQARHSASSTLLPGQSLGTAKFLVRQILIVIMAIFQQRAVKRPKKRRKLTNGHKVAVELGLGMQYLFKNL